MSGTLADQLRGRPARRGPLSPWAASLMPIPLAPAVASPVVSPAGSGQAMPAAYEMTVTAPAAPAPDLLAGTEDDTAFRRRYQAPPMEPLPYPPPPAPPVPRAATPAAAPPAGLTADDLNALVLNYLRSEGEQIEPRAGANPADLAMARTRIGRFGLGGAG